MIKPKTTFLITLSLSLFSIICSGQNTPKPVDSSIPFAQGLSYLYQEQYGSSVDEFNKIAKSDTNYVLAQLNAVIAHFFNEAYDKVPPISKKMIFDFDTYDTDFYSYYIRSLFELKKWNEANTVIREAKKAYPLFQKFSVYEAMCMKGLGEKELAEEMLKSILERNTFSADAHYELGKLAAENGRTVRAILSIHFAIISDNGMTNLSQAYTLLENLCNNNYSPDSKITDSDKTEFKEVYELVESGLALKDAYKSELGVHYSLSNQIDLIIKSIEYKESSSDFWMQFYVPTLVHMQKKELIPGYTMNFLRVYNSDLVKQLAIKYKDQTEKATEFIVAHYYKKSSVNQFPINGRTYELPYYYGAGNNLIASGKLNDDRERIGEWTMFNLKGKVSAILNYKNGELIGKNTWFDDFGNISSYYELSEDQKLNGEALFSTDLGIPKYKADYTNSELSGKFINYYDNGLLENSLQFSEGEKNGPYYEFNYAGDTTAIGSYLNNQLEGSYTEYYAGGQVATEIIFKEGSRDGIYKNYYRNGTLKSKGQYSKGKEVGKWEFFHKNGQLELFYTVTEKGKADGFFFELYANGDTSRTGYLKKGKLNGLETEYTADGKLYSKTIFKNGTIKSYQFFDSLGNVLSEGKKLYTVYDSFGYKYYEGNIKGKHGREGKWTYYYKNGNPSKEFSYVKGVLQGDAKWYFESGKLETVINYTDDEKNGKYLSYFENGSIQTEGWYIDGKKEGSWKEFNSKGDLIEETYYMAGYYDRFYTEYHQNGVLKAESFYNDEILQHISLFDSTGQLINKIDFQNGTGHYKADIVAKGITFVDGHFVGGERNGLFKFLYPNNQLSSSINYRYGTRHGVYKNYHYNGELFEEGTYKNGLKNGVWKQYHDNGKVSNIEQYENGNLIGRVYSFHENGKPKNKISIDAYGNKHGLDTVFNDNGTIARIVPYTRNFINGSYIVYDNNEVPMYKKYYNGDQLYAYSYLKDGKWIDKIQVGNNALIKTFYDNGKVSREYAMKANQRNGKSLSYYSSGQKWIECNYLYGDLHGEYKEYNEDGTVAEEGKFENGKRIGIHKWYNKKGQITDLKTYDNGTLNGISLYYSDQGKVNLQIQFYQGNPILISKK